MKITDSYVNEHIKSAVRQLLPDKAGQIWEQPVEKASGNEWYLDGTNRRRQNKGMMVKLLSSAAACLVICFLSYHMISLRKAATIYMDANPGIELQINGKEKVILAEAINEAGKVILEDMNLKNTDLDIAVNAILGSMVKHGYLGETQNVILLSVDSSNQEKTQLIRAQLSDEMNACLVSLLGSGSIFDQDVHVDDELKALALKYGITPGKAALLRRLIEETPNLDYAELAGLSMNDLAIYLRQKGIDLRDFVNYTGTVPYEQVSSDPADPHRNEDNGGEKTEDDTGDIFSGSDGKDGDSMKGTLPNSKSDNDNNAAEDITSSSDNDDDEDIDVDKGDNEDHYDRDDHDDEDEDHNKHKHDDNDNDDDNEDEDDGNDDEDGDDDDDDNDRRNAIKRDDSEEEDDEEDDD